MNTDQDVFKMARGLFSTFSEKFKPCHNQIVLLLQYYNLKRKSHYFAQEEMGRLHTKAIDCEYHEYDQRLREKFINRLDDEVMIGKRLRVPITL